MPNAIVRVDFRLDLQPGTNQGGRAARLHQAAQLHARRAGLTKDDVVNTRG